MITFEDAFVKTRLAVRQSIKTKLKSRGFYVDGDMDNDEFLGLQPDVLPGLTDPERAALHSAKERVKGVASGSGGAGAGAGVGAAAVVSQTSEYDRLHVDVLIDGPDQYQLPAALLFDTGCSIDFVISKYKADQLRMQPDEPKVCRNISLAGGSTTTATRYKPVKVEVLMIDNDITVPGQSAWLEAYCITGTQGAPLAGPSVPLPPGTVLTLQSADEAQAVGGSGTPPATRPTSDPVFKLRLSPVKRGRDSQGYDAILGKPGMHKLGLGMDKEGRLFAFAPEDQIISMA